MNAITTFEACAAVPALPAAERRRHASRHNLGHRDASHFTMHGLD
jgi:hypothetical protein